MIGFLFTFKIYSLSAVLFKHLLDEVFVICKAKGEADNSYKDQDS